MELLDRKDKIPIDNKAEHPLHPKDAKAKVIASHARSNLEKMYKKQAAVLPEGFGVGKANRAGFQIDTPFEGQYGKVWIKTGDEVEQEIDKTKVINEKNYPGISQLFTMPIFVDPDGQYLTLPFRPGEELQSAKIDELEPSKSGMIEAEVLSKFKKLHAMGLQLTDTKVGMGSNIVVNQDVQSANNQLTSFIDIATLEPSSESESKLNALQAQTELMYIMNKYMIINHAQEHHLDTVTNRTANFLSHLMDDESSEIFFNELANNIQLDSFVTTDTVKKILETFKTGFTKENFQIVHQKLYEANQEAELKFLADCLEGEVEF
jgi:hypothetical protein